MRPLLAWQLRAGLADERVELLCFADRKLCALPRSYLRRARRSQFVRPGLSHEDLDFALRGPAPFLRREFRRELFDGTRALRETLAQVFDATDREAFRVQFVRLVTERTQPTRQLAVQHLPEIRRGAEHFGRLERKPALAVRVPGRVREHGVRVQLRVEITAGVVQE